jgi:IS5 family transposase
VCPKATRSSIRVGRDHAPGIAFHQLRAEWTILTGWQLFDYGVNAGRAASHIVNRRTAQGVRYRVNRRGAAPHKPLSARWRVINQARSRTRARGEHPCHVVKRLWGFAKVRHRGIAKNLARAFSPFALANLYLVRRQLLPPQARCVL